MFVVLSCGLLFLYPPVKLYYLFCDPVPLVMATGFLSSTSTKQALSLLASALLVLSWRFLSCIIKCLISLSFDLHMLTYMSWGSLVDLWAFGSTQGPVSLANRQSLSPCFNVQKWLLNVFQRWTCQQFRVQCFWEKCGILAYYRYVTLNWALGNKVEKMFPRWMAYDNRLIFLIDSFR